MQLGVLVALVHGISVQVDVLAALRMGLPAQTSAVLALDLGRAGLAIEAVDLVQSLVV